MSKTSIILALYEIGAIQFGAFTLRSGLPSPFYLDLRRVVSYPNLLADICQQLGQVIQPLDFELICGVPYAALSFATGISMQQNIPAIVKRKQRKKYGYKKLVEGVFEKGQTCIVVEDTMTSGISLVETLDDLQQEGLKVQDAVIIVDREQGGKDTLERKGYKVHALFTITQILETLQAEGKIDAQTVADTLAFIHQNYIPATPPTPPPPPPVPSYTDRIEKIHHPVTKKLLATIEQKQTNLIFSADVADPQQLLALADQVGPHICALKTHVDILPECSQAFIDQLTALAQKHQFLLFEDRKFADIGSTVQKQFTADLCNIPTWADLVTVHVIGGSSTINALKATGHLNNTGLVVIVQMSTSDTLTDESYIQKAVDIAENQKEVVVGIVAQKRFIKDWGMIQFTPGINLATKGDQHGQTYNTPTVAFQERGTDVMIVGRGIYQAENPVQAAIAYKTAGWEAYEMRHNMVSC